MTAEQKEAWDLYMQDKQYKEIAEIVGKSVHTLRSWQKKFKWKRGNNHTPKGKNTTSYPKGEVFDYKTIRGGLMDQLEKNGNTEAHFVDLLNDYMEMWVIKNQLISDIRERGVQVDYKNGQNQFGKKKNDSVSELIKYNVQMLNLLKDLGLKDIGEGDDDVEL